MQVIVKGGEPYAVDFVCPCGCGNSCYTPLVTDQHPRVEGIHRWSYAEGDAGPTLAPSIRWTGECKAHFTITNGEAVFHSDTGK